MVLIYFPSESGLISHNWRANIYTRRHTAHMLYTLKQHSQHGFKSLNEAKGEAIGEELTA